MMGLALFQLNWFIYSSSVAAPVKCVACVWLSVPFILQGKHITQSPWH